MDKCKFQDKCLLFAKKDQKDKDCNLYILDPIRNEEDFCSASKSYDAVLDSICSNAEEVRQDLKSAKEKLVSKRSEKPRSFIYDKRNIEEYFANGGCYVVTEEQFKEIEEENKHLREELAKLKRVGGYDILKEVYKNKILSDKLSSCKNFLQYILDKWELDTKSVQELAIKLLEKL